MLGMSPIKELQEFDLGGSNVLVNKKIKTAASHIILEQLQPEGLLEYILLKEAHIMRSLKEAKTESGVGK